MEKTNCMLCKEEMDCPEKMLAAKVHICNSCIENISEKDLDNPDFLNILKKLDGTIKGMDKKLEKCDKVANEITNMEFNLFLKENDIKSLSRKNAARKAFTEGSFSTLSFIMFGGMEEEFLDSMLKSMKEVKVQKEKG